MDPSNGEISKKLGSKLEKQQKNLCSFKKFNPRPKLKFNKQIKELGLSHGLHYCSYKKCFSYPNHNLNIFMICQHFLRTFRGFSILLVYFSI